MVAINLSREDILKLIKVYSMSNKLDIKKLSKILLNTSLPTLHKYLDIHSLKLIKLCSTCGKETKSHKHLYCSNKCIPKKRFINKIKKITECPYCNGYSVSKSGLTCGSKECKLAHRRSKNNGKYNKKRKEYFKKYFKENKDYFNDWRIKNKENINRRQRKKKNW